EDGSGTATAHAATYAELPGILVWYDAGSFSTREVLLTNYDYTILLPSNAAPNYTDERNVSWQGHTSPSRVVWNYYTDQTQSVQAMNWQSNSVSLYVVTNAPPGG